MKLPSPLIDGILIRRYKRFLADVRLSGGETVTVHCPNTGAMLGCADPGSRVWMSRAENPDRKYPLTWEIVETANGVRVGVHPARANRLVREAIKARRISELRGYERIRTEVRYGPEKSRIDLLLESGVERDRCYVEVKSVTAAEGSIGLFPDAVTVRGARHLRDLTAMVAQRQRAVIFFCVQRDDVAEVRPADAIDPVYGETLRAALQAGVEAIAYRVSIRGREIRLASRVPVHV